MPHALRSHSLTPCPAVRSLQAVAELDGRLLRLGFQLAADLEALSIPPPAETARSDGLWAHTCFEAFVGLGGDEYLEFNLSPSGRWAAYRFDAYREGMAPLHGIEAPRIEALHRAGELEVRAILDLPTAGPIQLGLTAVIEAKDGALSYWALAHASGPPDFHRADGRVLSL